IGYSSEVKLSRPEFLVGLYDELNRRVFWLDSSIVGTFPDSLPKNGSVTCRTGPINLTPGPFHVNVAVRTGGVLADHIVSACSVEVEAIDFYGTGKLTDRQTALCLVQQEWGEQ
ncbi:MAG: hypothetical protein JSV68_04470, partial [Anaerolineaceae bacterium]